VVVPIAIGRVDVFTGKEYRDILINSIGFCQRKKDLLLHCWCIMSNHVHLIASAKNEDLSDILRDFKKFTSKKIITAIENNDHESRKNWMLKIFNEQGQGNSRNKNYQFWRQDNQPQELYSPKFFFQKLNYMHNNPIVAGIVEKPEHYLYSSARDYFERRKCGLLEVSFL